jgi:hypothetical protein
MSSLATHPAVAPLSDVLALFPKCSACGSVLELGSAQLDETHPNRAHCERCAISDPMVSHRSVA